MKRWFLRLAVVFTFLATSGTALAEGFALYEYSARGVALGGSVMARRPDPSSVAYNPALITRLKGTQLQAGTSVIRPSGHMDTRLNGSTQRTHLKNSHWLIPHFYFTQELTDSLTFGVGEFTRFGLGFDYPKNWPGRYNIYSVNLTTASVNPNIAWAVTDKLSLAAGVDVTYVTLDINKKSPIGATGFEIDSDIDNADAFGLGVNLAGHYQFNDQWAVGLAYRSQVQVRAKGNNAITTNLPAGVVIPGVPANGDYKAHSTVVLPDSIAGGIAWSPRSDFSIEAGAVWTRWSTFRTLRIHTDTLGVNESKKKWDDAWRFNVGVEYDANDWLTLRASYVFDQSPMTETYEDYLVPTDDRHMFSVGAGFHWDSWTVDLAYSRIEAVGRSYAGNESLHTLPSKAAGQTDIVSMSVGYAF